jgi:hypothetical protein
MSQSPCELPARADNTHEVRTGTQPEQTRFDWSARFVMNVAFRPGIVQVCEHDG